MEIELDVLSVESMIIFERVPFNTSRQRGRTNSPNVQYGQRADFIADAINRHKSGQTECKCYRS